MLTTKSKVSELFANEQAVAILEKHIPNFNPSNEKLEPVTHVSLAMLAKLSGGMIPKEALKAVEEELQAAKLD